jgi:ATP-dependent RNA helicase RhlE
VFGGVGYGAQQQALRAGVDILVATPGRLLDWLSRREVSLNQVETFVLDEADRMLDMGFLPAIRTVLAALPRQRQTLFFSATMPNDICELAGRMLTSPERVEVAPVATTADKIDQRVYLVERQDKRGLLLRLLGDGAVTRALVFTNTKRGANRVVEQLVRASVRAEAIHGNKSQGARERALAQFKNGATRVLVATDIAARGIDVEGISHVINFDLPAAPENYVHRIGRTARAGAAGIALSFCANDERGNLASIERTIRTRVPVVAQPGGILPAIDGPLPVAGHGPRALPSKAGRPSSRFQGRRPGGRSAYATR